MKSLPTIDNQEKYWEIIQKVEPEFYLMRLQMKKSGINPMIMPRIIRALERIATGTGWGEVNVQIQNTKVTIVDYKETDKVEETIYKEKFDKDK